jgi:hypothetical protein
MGHLQHRRWDLPPAIDHFAGVTGDLYCNRLARRSASYATRSLSDGVWRWFLADSLDRIAVLRKGHSASGWPPGLRRGDT